MVCSFLHYFFLILMSRKGADIPNAKLNTSMQDTATGKGFPNAKTCATERFNDTIASLSCSSTALKMKFKNEDDYTLAKNSWNWVNQNSNRYFVMVVAWPSCGGDRRPYKVTSYTSNNATMTITMSAAPKDFQKAFPYMKLSVATNGILDGVVPTGTRKRASLSTSIPISLEHDFSGTKIFDAQAEDVDVSLNCGTCNTAGTLNIDAELSFNLFSSPTLSGTISVTPSGVAATVGLSLTASGEVTQAIDESVNFVTFTLPGGISIPLIGMLGPSLMVDMVATISSITASATVNLGSVTMSIDDNSKAQLDLANSANNVLTGFTPTFSAEGPSVDAGISASAQFGPQIILGIDAEVFGTGAAAGLALNAPSLNLNAAIEATAADNGCAGVEFDVDLSAQLNAFGGVGKIKDVAATDTFSIIGTSTQIFSTCLSFPGQAAATTAAATTAAASATPGAGSFGGTVGSTLSDQGCMVSLLLQSSFSTSKSMLTMIAEPWRSVCFYWLRCRQYFNMSSPIRCMLPRVNNLRELKRSEYRSHGDMLFCKLMSERSKAGSTSPMLYEWMKICWFRLFSSSNKHS
jgi:hypothetical protein